MDIKQNYQTLLSNVTYIKQQFANNSEYLPQIQKINSSPDFIVLHIRFFRKTWNIYLGRGGTGTGIMLSSLNVPLSLRVKDKFLDLVRAYLNHSYLKSIEIDSEDRIINIKTVRFSEKKQIEINFYFFWKGRELYFYIVEKAEMIKILKSWEGNWNIAEAMSEMTFPVFDEVGRCKRVVEHGQININLPSNDEIIEKHFKETISKVTEQVIKKNQKKSIKKIENIKKDLNKLRDWKEFYLFFLNNEKEVLKNDSYKIGEAKIKFDPKLSYYKKRNLVFERCKKASSNIGLVEGRLKAEEVKLKEAENKNLPTRLMSSQIKSKIMDPVWSNASKNTSASTSEVKSENHIVLKTALGEFAIGLNAIGNDVIRKKWGSKESYWFHADGMTSCHVIMNSKQNTQLDQQLLELIGSMIIDYSLKGQNEVNLVYTQVKYLKSLKGSPGAVTYKREKRIKIVYQNRWREIISAS